MRAALSATLITPLVFWACGTTPGTDNMIVDSGVGATDTGARDTGPNGDAGFNADATIDADGGFNADADVDAGTPDSGFDAGTPCTYPAGSVEPMTRDQVITPYAWANAIDPSGATGTFDLTSYFCNTNLGHDFSATEAIFFVSSVDW